MLKNPTVCDPDFREGKDWHLRICWHWFVTMHDGQTSQKWLMIWVPSDWNEPGLQRAACPECPDEPQVPCVQPCSSLESLGCWQAGPMGLCRSCRVAVSLLPLCSPSRPWSGPLCLQNSPALAAELERVPLTPTQPSGSPLSRSCSGLPASPCSTGTPRQKLWIVFLFKNKAGSRFLWQPWLLAKAPCLASCHARGAAGPASPCPLATDVSPHPAKGCSSPRLPRATWNYY